MFTNNSTGIGEIISLNQYEQRVIELENLVIDLIEHVGQMEDPGAFIDSTMETLMSNKITERMPDECCFNPLIQG
jgi:hypothetical protein